MTAVGLIDRDLEIIVSLKITMKFIGELHRAEI